jgi:hypothetical protein
MKSRRNSFSGQFSGRLIEMMESDAWRALSLAGRRVIDRVEIEHGHHGGTDNGKLPVTFDQFCEYGFTDIRSRQVCGKLSRWAS